MATYSYIARTGDGQRVTGQLSGSNEQAVLVELESRQLAPVRVDEVRDAKNAGRKVSPRQLAQTYQQLSDLMRAGVPLLRALRLVGRTKKNPRLGNVLKVVAEQVSEGSSLADAMAEHERVFPAIQIAMVRAGERGGFLEPVLVRMSAFLEHQADMRGSVVGAMIYPCVLLFVGFCIIMGALLVFVPKFEEFYGRMDVPLPTEILLAASTIVREAWPAVLITLGVIVVFVQWFRTRPVVRRKVAHLVLRTPRFGTLVSSLAVARFARILGTLLENGIPLIGAMDISRDAAGHVLLEDAIELATEEVRAGETLATPLSESGLFSEDVIEMIRVGEEANNLSNVLVTIADTIEKRIDRMLAIALRLLEPLILLLLGIAVFFIFIALVLPMMQLSGSV